MRRGIRLVIAALTLAGAVAAGIPQASATECNPRGCSGGCKVSDPRDASIDLDTLTITLPSPITCYS